MAPNSKKLQVLIDGDWKYVFCRNILNRDPITAEHEHNALNSGAMGYFKEHFANHEFREAAV